MAGKSNIYRLKHTLQVPAEFLCDSEVSLSVDDGAGDSPIVRV